MVTKFSHLVHVQVPFLLKSVSKMDSRKRIIKLNKLTIAAVARFSRKKISFGLSRLLSILCFLRIIISVK